jgi:hypothetical protein
LPGIAAIKKNRKLNVRGLNRKTGLLSYFQSPHMHAQDHAGELACTVFSRRMRLIGNQRRDPILRTPENSVPQTIVFRYKEIGDKLCGKQRKNSYAPF